MGIASDIVWVLDKFIREQCEKFVIDRNRFSIYYHDGCLVIDDDSYYFTIEYSDPLFFEGIQRYLENRSKDSPSDIYLGMGDYENRTLSC